MLIKDCNRCGTGQVKGLDAQLIAMTLRLCPGFIVPIMDLNVVLGDNVHPYLQKPAHDALFRAIAGSGRKLEINSAWRTIAAQCLLYIQADKKICGVTLVGYPGHSNHQSAAAIDINDYNYWKWLFVQNEWIWFGSADEVHFDYKGDGIIDIRQQSVLAFQKLWNLANANKLTEDGLLGKLTFAALSQSPTDGFYTGDLYLPNRYLSDRQQSGHDVLYLQNFLHGLGIKVSDTANFDQQTVDAVKVFQTRSKLTPDGVVGEKTWALINNFHITDTSSEVSLSR